MTSNGRRSPRLSRTAWSTTPGTWSLGEGGRSANRMILPGRSLGPRDMGQERPEPGVAADCGQVGVDGGPCGLDAAVPGAAKEVERLIDGTRAGQLPRRDRGDAGGRVQRLARGRLAVE